MSAGNNFVSQTQDDGEEEIPSFVKNRPSYLGPDIFTLKRMQAEAEENKKAKEEDSSSSDDDDQDMVFEVPDPKTKPTSSDWLQRISKRELAKKQLKLAIEKQEKSRTTRHGKFRVGGYVYTRDKRIAAKSASPKPGGKRCYRLKCYGTLVKESAFYEDVWLVKFDDGRTFACSEALLRVHISTTSPSHRLGRDASNNLTTEKLDRSFEDREVILESILNSKIHQTEGHQDVTYDHLLAIFKPQYAWLTASKLRKYVSMSRRLRAINTPNSTAASGTWMSELPFENESQNESKKLASPSNDQCTEDSNTSTKKKTLALEITGRNHAESDDDKSGGLNDDDDKGDDFMENHGLACTCCGVRSDLLTKSDLSHMHGAKAMTGLDSMITKIRTTSNSRSVTVTAIPTAFRKNIKATEQAGIDVDQKYINKLNELQGINRRIDNDGTVKVVDMDDSNVDDGESVVLVDVKKDEVDDAFVCSEDIDDISVGSEDCDADDKSAVFDGEGFVLVDDMPKHKKGECQGKV